MNYPNGNKFVTPNIEKKTKEKKHLLSAANRGMNLESDINNANEYYRDKAIAVIYKRPTPINIVKVDYSRGARIIDAYFEKQSTTDYNGVYKGKYIDFEAKNTRNKTSFPLRNIAEHQINHLKQVINQGGIIFFIIGFEMLGEIYLIDGSYIIEYYLKKERMSIPYDIIKTHGIMIDQGYNPRLDYIKAVDELYFKNK